MVIRGALYQQQLIVTSCGVSLNLKQSIAFFMINNKYIAYQLPTLSNNKTS
jgi:hypothetical protein